MACLREGLGKQGALPFDPSASQGQSQTEPLFPSIPASCHHVRRFVRGEWSTLSDYLPSGHIKIAKLEKEKADLPMQVKFA